MPQALLFVFEKSFFWRSLLAFAFGLRESSFLRLLVANSLLLSQICFLLSRCFCFLALMLSLFLSRSLSFSLLGLFACDFCTFTPTFAFCVLAFAIAFSLLLFPRSLSRLWLSLLAFFYLHLRFPSPLPHFAYRLPLSLFRFPLPPLSPLASATTPPPLPYGHYNSWSR